MMLNFEEYINGHINKPEYEPEQVKKRFYQVVSILGEEDKNELIASITLRLKNKVRGVDTDWGTANSVANGLSILISRRFWDKKSKYGKMPFVSSIENNKNWDKEHLHILIRMSEIELAIEDFEIEAILRVICLNLKEVNKNFPDSVNIRTFPYLENQYKTVGNAIHYVCKTSKTSYNPLLRQLKDGTLINE